MSTTVAPAITIEIRTEQGVEMRAMDRAEALNHGRVLAGECRRTRREYKAAMLALGQFLKQVQRVTEWGSFGAWRSECGIHKHTAYRAMRLVDKAATEMEVDRDHYLALEDADDDAILAGGSVSVDAGNGGVSFASNNAKVAVATNYQDSVRVQERSAFTSNNANTTSVANYQDFVRYPGLAHNHESENCGASDAAVVPGIDLVKAFAAGVVHPCQEIGGKNTGAVAEQVVAKIERPAAQLLLDQVYEAQREAREAMAFVTGWLAGPDANRDAASIAAMLREIRTFKERAEKVAAAKAGA